MYFNPTLYQKVVRPKFAIEKYIKKILFEKFNFDGAAVLDFGCGTGSNAFMFQPERYIGVDVDERRVAFANASFPEYAFRVIENGTLSVHDACIDCICIVATLHHIPDAAVREYVKEFKRVLKPGGKIVAIEPVLSERHRFRNWFMKTFDDGKFIRHEEQYRELFGEGFQFTVHKRFRKFFFYSELFFSASPKQRDRTAPEKRR